MVKHFIELQNVSKTQLEEYFRLADKFYDASQGIAPRRDELQGKTICNLFFEDSTRTANSFYLAGTRIGASVLDFTGAGSSLSKGETLLDTARNIYAMGIDCFVIRHVCPGAPQMIADALNVPVVNAGDGSHEHPTQGLLDVYTIYRELGSVDKFKGLTVGVVGDILHSRVARSLCFALRTLGAKVVLVGPRTLVNDKFKVLGDEVSDSLDKVLADVDVLYFLRMQRERMRTGLIPSLKEYKFLYGMTEARMKMCSDDVKIMHPGPINRGVEIDPEVADGPNSLILKQVASGMASRMAVLYSLIGENRG